MAQIILGHFADKEIAMAEFRCIARAYANEPLDRVAVAFERKLTFIANGKGVENVDNLEHVGAIGFPSECVFEFDAKLFDALQTAYILGDDLDALWAQAVPLKADLPQLERA